jgi:outer membrane receptor protein involved in Fe transport
LAYASTQGERWLRARAQNVTHNTTVGFQEMCRRVARVTAWSRVASGSCLAVLLLTALAARAAPPAALPLDIPPQSLRSALTSWAQQTEVHVVYLADLIHDQKSHGAKAGLPIDTALDRLLAGTGLRFEYLTPREVRISAAAATREAQAKPAVAAVNSADDVVITGSRLQGEPRDAPANIVVWTMQDLQAAQVTDAGRLANLTPGVEFDSYQDYGAGIETNVSIRGVNSRDGSTIAVYLDDIPIPTDRASIFGRAYPLLFDLDRVDVLRGPQGVLMGEGAEGGALRFVRPQPSAAVFSVGAHAEYAGTQDGAPSYEFGGSLGGPLLKDKIGFRLSAWTRHDGGFVDRVDPYTMAPLDLNANSAQLDSFSAAAVFRIGAVSLIPGVDYHSVNIHDSSAFFTFLSSPGDGLLRSGKWLAQPYFDRYRLPSLAIVAELGDVKLLSESAFFDRWANAFADTTNYNAQPNPLGSPATANGVAATLDQRVVSQQLRIENTDLTARVRWLAGMQYVHAHYFGVQDLVNEAVADGGGVDGRLYPHLGTVQTAAFGQADIRLPRRFTATLALRAERDSYDSLSVTAARSLAPTYNEFFSAHDSNTELAPHFALSLQPDDRHLYYLSAAKGYRMGGANLPLGAECGTPTPATYAPDSVWSYELGAKMSSAGSRLQSDVSVFHAVWSNLQLQIPYESCGFGYTSNAGAAVSNGIDLGVDAALTSRLDLRVLAAYADAHYTQTVYFEDHVVVQNGDAIGALPLVPSPFTASSIATYTLPLYDSVVALRAQDVFHSRNHGPFSSDNPDAVIYAPERQPDPATNQLDLSISVSRQALQVSAYLLNTFNAQPTLQLRDRAAGDTLLFANTFRPRTIGIEANWRLQ